MAAQTKPRKAPSQPPFLRIFPPNEPPYHVLKARPWPSLATCVQSIVYYENKPRGLFGSEVRKRATAMGYPHNKARWDRVSKELRASGHLVAAKIFLEPPHYHRRLVKTVYFHRAIAPVDPQELLSYHPGAKRVVLTWLPPEEDAADSVDHMTSKEEKR